MAKNYKTVVSIDAVDKRIHYYRMLENDKTTITHDVTSYKQRLYDPEFYIFFGNMLNEYKVKYPSNTNQEISIVLPDNAIVTDTITVPTMSFSGAVKNAVNVSINGMYKNKSELKINSSIITANKQFSSFGVVMIKNKILEDFKNICNQNKISISNITFSSNSTINAITTLKTKLKQLTYVFLNIKDNSSKIIFVIKGRTIGFYSLPFGLQVLEKQKLASEDMLFDHQVAELACLNAREKAKAKELTMLEENEDEEEIENNSLAERTELGRRQARKLPKFMLRDTPTTEEGVCYENFRIFLKWTLDVIKANDNITELATFDTVYVDLPNKYDFLFEMVNKEQEENKVKFSSLELEEFDEINKNLEVYGGFFTNLNKINNF